MKLKFDKKLLKNDSLEILDSNSLKNIKKEVELKFSRSAVYEESNKVSNERNSKNKKVDTNSTEKFVKLKIEIIDSGVGI